MAEILIKGIGIPKDKPIGVVIYPSGRVEVPDRFEARFTSPIVDRLNFFIAQEISEHGDLYDKKDIFRELYYQIEDLGGLNDVFAIEGILREIPIAIPASKE